ncbi:MAG: flavin reductase family protein [Spirochaetaceae bacterium]|jgi:flavin reductase (DIM6/NTAB) family NADH-FMN oxidoreductase RutF|nr:flavin reductase family protein [Spirochaetaceae bacterium]
MEQQKRVNWKAGTLIYPVPAVMVSCGTMEKSNIITVAWTGTINTNPPMCYISIRPERYSYSMIKESGEFIINLTTRELARATDWCGVKSGKDYNKFKKMNLTAIEGTQVKAPGIVQSPLQLECRVTEIKELGSHHMFLAEVLCVTVDPKYLDKDTGAFDMNKAGLLAFSHGKYYGLTQPLGKFGYSIQKKKNRAKK